MTTLEKLNTQEFNDLVKAYMNCGKMLAELRNEQEKFLVKTYSEKVLERMKEIIKVATEKDFEGIK